MLHNDQQDRMLNLAHSASGLTVSGHKGVVVGKRLVLKCSLVQQNGMFTLPAVTAK